MNTSMGNRHLLVLSGELSNCRKCANKLTATLETLVLDDPKKANNVLGQEFDAVIFNSFSSFDANAFGAVSGTIRAGGYLLLLKPEKYPENSLFLERFETIIKNFKAKDSNWVRFIDVPCSNTSSLFIPPKKHTSFNATSDQITAVKAICHVVTGHRRRPLVITSDRGRGKSASLGMAAAQLIAEGYLNIIICAPSKKATEVIYQFADINNSSNSQKLNYYSPDALNREKPKADLVLIDEAAAIPITLLSKLLNHYSRLVFTTTLHGYEGSGRGFAINFRKVLNEKTPQWTNVELEQPIRWAENDSLEKFTFDALLLNAEAVNSRLIEKTTLSNSRIVTIDRQQISENDEQLSELFGLLVSAHYQTKPSDLMQVLDDDAVSIHTLQFNQHIIAVILLIKEGEIEVELSQAIFQGTRRIKGHLMAQSLAANAGIEGAPMLKGERISRIAVHPDLQQQGFGTKLLEAVVNKTDVDYVGTSFGASKEVITFWQRAGFKAVYLGMKRDASSGTHSVLMVLAKSQKGQDLMAQASQRFTKHFPLLLAEPFKMLEAEIALILLHPMLCQYELGLSAAEKRELCAFAYHQRGYENTLYPLWAFALNSLPSSKLTADENSLLLHKLLQKQTWTEIVNTMGLTEDTGKKELLKRLRQALKKLLE